MVLLTGYERKSLGFSEAFQEGGPRVKIVRIPKRLEGFFAPLRGLFRYERTFQHFRVVVLAMALLGERRTVTRLAPVIAAGPHRSRLNELVTSSPWHAQAIVQEIAKGQLASLKLKPGDRVRLRLDDTRKPKRGKKLPGVAKYFDHILHAYRWGHTYVGCLLEVNGQIIPWGIRLDLKKAWGPKGGQPVKQLSAYPGCQTSNGCADSLRFPRTYQGLAKASNADKHWSA